MLNLTKLRFCRKSRNISFRCLSLNGSSLLNNGAILKIQLSAKQDTYAKSTPFRGWERAKRHPCGRHICSNYNQMYGRTHPRSTPPQTFDTGLIQIAITDLLARVCKVCLLKIKVFKRFFSMYFDEMLVHFCPIILCVFF